MSAGTMKAIIATEDVKMMLMSSALVYLGGLMSNDRRWRRFIIVKFKFILYHLVFDITKRGFNGVRSRVRAG